MSRNRASLLALSGAALSAALLVAGCSLSDGPVKKAERTYTVRGKVTVIEAGSFGGDITVRPLAEGADKVRVTERYEYSGSKPNPEHSLSDGRFTVKKTDCGNPGKRCTVHLTVLAPPSVAVDLKTQGGDVTVEGTSGGVDAETSGGDIRVEDSASRSVRAHTRGGNVTVSSTAVPDAVDGRTQGGDVTVRVPQGAYAVEASTSGGNRKVTVPSTAGAPHRIKAVTQGGNVSVVN
ncbi:DUF4097 family beta strand repeat-containing protein [Streptomyces huiliensis]|uniref:DUF4097 family beta strand repeat-containing protein n=1 Tax=Streptomyces huiliensis TaxID=2876027 RepID=UPI001CBF05F1|nr:DUF4097 family beta strand repeat-containing protein [Streptomyces huiliensis]MBZ4319680.1 DUF4097 domain-containing protein [Streptomyces huiliensis]